MNSNHLEIISLRLKGKRLSEISRIKGVSRQRIHKILTQHNIWIKIVKFQPEGLEKQFNYHKNCFSNHSPICKVHGSLKRFTIKSGFYCRDCADRSHRIQQIKSCLGRRLLNKILENEV